MNTTKQPSKFSRFIRNNVALLLLIFCVLAITAVVLAVTLTRDNTPIDDNPVVNNPNDDEPGNTKPSEDDPTVPSKKKINVYFSAPVAYDSVGMEFTFGPSNLFVFKSTLNEWSAHKAVDLAGNEGDEVKAMYDGTVIDVGYTFLKGYYVTVDHGENVIATYASVKDTQVTKGATVKQGDVIAYIGTTAENEYREGPHLHLEVLVDNKAVDPMPYVNGEVFRTIEVDA